MFETEKNSLSSATFYRDVLVSRLKVLYSCPLRGFEKPHDINISISIRSRCEGQEESL